jgi:hypothetical protein
MGKDNTSFSQDSIRDAIIRNYDRAPQPDWRGLGVHMADTAPENHVRCHLVVTEEHGYLILYCADCWVYWLTCVPATTEYPNGLRAMMFASELVMLIGE